jgi:hypothetical protein
MFETRPLKVSGRNEFNFPTTNRFLNIASVTVKNDIYDFIEKSVEVNLNNRVDVFGFHAEVIYITNSETGITLRISNQDFGELYKCV